VKHAGTPWVTPDPWAPQTFNWLRHEGSRYDYFLIRSRTASDFLFRGSGEAVALLARHGAWQLYGRQVVR